MREIKFRAWDKRRNIYGKVVSLDMDDSEWFKERHAGHSGRVSLENPKNERDCGSWGSWIDFVDLEQFTGLHDKNGKEIYEGDVVYNKWNRAKGHVHFMNGSFWVQDATGFSDNDFCWEDLKVIGNIHENPELLNAH